MMGYGAGFGFGFGGLLALLGCVLLVVGIVVLVVWAVGRSGQSAQVAPGQASGRSVPDAIDVLRQRFARGEITADEFTAAKQLLEAGR
jgi:putative membrane protein